MVMINTLGSACALLPGVRYDKIMVAFGGLRLVVSGPADLKQALNEAMQFDGPALVNVLIDPPAGRRPQQFSSLG